MDYKTIIESFARAKNTPIFYDVIPPESPFYGVPNEGGPNGLHLRPWGTDSDELTFWTSMHELGHAYVGSIMTREDFFYLNFLGSGGPHELHDEASAWLWALENSPVQPTDGVRGLIALSMSGYVAQDGTEKVAPLCKLFRIILASNIDTTTIKPYFPSDYYAGAVLAWPHVKDTYAKL